jgi:hypothetical protein
VREIEGNHGRRGRSFHLHTPHRPRPTYASFHFHLPPSLNQQCQRPSLSTTAPCLFRPHPIVFTTPTLSTIPTKLAPSPLASPHSTGIPASVPHRRDQVIHLLPNHRLNAIVTRACASIPPTQHRTHRPTGTRHGYPRPEDRVPFRLGKSSS